MIDFETWWNSSSADEFRRLNDDMDGRVVRPVWDAAIRATLSSQKATSAAPSPEATQPTQAEAPSEREALTDEQIDSMIPGPRVAGPFCAMVSIVHAREAVRAALATQPPAVQGEPIGWASDDGRVVSAELVNRYPEHKHQYHIPLYLASPPSREVEPLTDEQQRKLLESADHLSGDGHFMDASDADWAADWIRSYVRTNSAGGIHSRGEGES